MRYSYTITLVTTSDDRDLLARDRQISADNIAGLIADMGEKFEVDFTITEIIDTDGPAHTNLGDEHE